MAYILPFYNKLLCCSIIIRDPQNIEMGSYRLFFAIIGSTEPIWDVTIDDIELLAGMLAVGTGIIEDLNSVLTYATSVQYYVDSDTDVSDFRLLPDISEDNLRSNSLRKLSTKQYGIWLKGRRRFYYSLYTFRTNTFFQGIVSMANTFGVDFRNYLYGFPFDAYGNLYALGDYIMAPDQIAIDAPDIDDFEQDEEDDENIIEPLARTDDIITLKE